jgi:hypothetical protein
LPYNIENGKAVEGKSIHNLIGFNSDQAKYYREMVDRVRNRAASSPMTNEEMVTIGRLYKIGHEDTKITNVGGQFNIDLTDKEFKDTFDFDSVYRGIEEQERIYNIAHEAKNMVNGMTLAESQILNAARLVNKDSTLLHGHNIIDFDIPILNRAAYGGLFSDEFTKEFNNIGFNIPASKVIDTFPALKSISKHAGGMQFFKDVIGQAKDPKSTYLALENITSMFGLQEGASHNAYGDTIGALNFLLGKDGNIQNSEFSIFNIVALFLSRFKKEYLMF